MGIRTRLIILTFLISLSNCTSLYAAAIQGKEESSVVGYCQSIDFVGAAQTLTASGLNCTLTDTSSPIGGITASYVCQSNGFTINCDLVKDGSGACSAGTVCTGGHTHVGVNETYGSGWNADTATPEKDDVYDWGHIFDTDDDGKVSVFDMTAGVVTTDTVGSAGVITTLAGLNTTLGSNIADGAHTPDQVGTLTNTKWCSSDGSVVNCTEDSPAGAGDITSVGDCLAGACLVTGGNITANTVTSTTFTGALTGNASTATALVGGEADPQIGGVTADSVCQANGVTVDCNLTQDGSGDCAAGAVCLGNHTHSTYLSSESDPQVGGVTATYVATGNGLSINAELTTDGSGDCSAGAVCLGNHTHSSYLTTESDPQVGGVTIDSVCQANGVTVDCNLTKDSSGSCGAGNVCIGGHTHPTTELSGVNVGTDLTADLEEESVAEAYDTTNWDSDTGVAQKNDIRDKVETLASLESPQFTTGIGVNIAPGGILHTSTSNGYSQHYFDVYDNGAATYPAVNFRKSASDTTGTIAQTANGAYLGGLLFWGANSSNARALGGQMVVPQDGSSDTQVPANISFNVYDGTTYHEDVLTIHNDGNVGIGDSSPAALFTVGNGDKFQVDSSGNITMAASTTIDAGASTSLEIPNAAAPTVNAAGEIAVDTTDDQLIFYGGAARVISYKQQKCVTLEDPVDADDNIPFFHSTDAIAILAVTCEVDGGTSIDLTISDGTNALEAITCDDNGAADDGSIANGTFTADERMEFDLSGASGTNTWLNFCITYSTTAE